MWFILKVGPPDFQGIVSAIKWFYYPAVLAGRFETYAQPNTGHCHQLHYNVAAGFAKVHAFLAKQEA